MDGNCRFRAISDPNPDSTEITSEYAKHIKNAYVLFNSGRPGLESPRLPLFLYGVNRGPADLVLLSHRQLFMKFLIQ